jgi:hypothetical protein
MWAIQDQLKIRVSLVRFRLWAPLKSPYFVALSGSDQQQEFCGLWLLGYFWATLRKW